MALIDDETLADAVAAGIREDRRRQPRSHVIQTGTVVSADYGAAKTVRVRLDNEDAATPCQIGAPGLYAGARCWVQFLERGGAYAFGPIGWSHPWRDFDPTIIGGGVFVSRTIIRSRYSLDQSTVDAEVEATVTSAGGVGSLRFGLPIPARTTGTLLFVGWGSWYRVGVDLAHGRARVFAQDQVDFLRDGSDTPMGVANPTFQLAANDKVQFTVRYEAAV